MYIYIPLKPARVTLSRRGQCRTWIDCSIDCPFRRDIKVFIQNELGKECWFQYRLIRSTAWVPAVGRNGNVRSSAVYFVLRQNWTELAASRQSLTPPCTDFGRCFLPAQTNQNRPKPGPPKRGRQGLGHHSPKAKRATTGHYPRLSRESPIFPCFGALFLGLSSA